MSPPPSLNTLRVEVLVMGVIHEDREAWLELVLLLEPWIEHAASSHWRMRRALLARSEDDVRDVFVNTLERLSEFEHRNLREYVERKRTTSAKEISCEAWLMRVVDYAVRDHIRARYGRRRKTRASVPPS